MNFAVERSAVGVSALAASGLPALPERTVRIQTVDRPALVLGSTQPDAIVDRAACEDAGVVVVRRRSGGGAVLLDPGAVVWVDVVVPATDHVWTEDVGRSFWWLGEAWTMALAPFVGDQELVVHRGGSVASPWSGLVCFAGLGPGEVTARGRKVVGMAQRRTRAGALFQCAVLRRWDAPRLAALLQLPPADRSRLVADLRDAVVSLDAVPGDEIDAAFLGALDALPE